MATRVLVRDRYQAEHWIDEEQLAFEPWRGCEVLDRQDVPDYVEQPAEPTPAPQPAPEPTPTRQTTKAAPRPASEDKEQ